MRTPQLARGGPLGGFLALVVAILLAACRPTTDTSAGPGDRTRSPDDEAPAHTGAPGQASDDAATGDSAQPEGKAPEGSTDDPQETDQNGTPSGDRELLVDEDHDQYTHVEGTGFENGCETDADCFAGGCSSEICSAEQDVSSPCIMPAQGWASQGGSCGCVEGMCSWYEAGGESSSSDDKGKPTPGRSPQALDGQGEACKGGSCADPLTCLKYYGVAGPQGPEFSSCEIPCPQGDGACPEGQTCVTIADGPGQVCRARPGR